MTGRDTRQTKCDELYERIVSRRSDNGYDLFDLAACFLGGFRPEHLRAMLRSDEPGLVADGLFVAAEIGDLAIQYVDDFELLSKNNDEEILQRATHLLKVYGPLRRRLGPES